jgi:ABC-type multidrug transport system fused ATPase/permease subunit
MSLPRIHGGRRKAILRRLVANGVAQASLAFAIAWLLRGALGSSGGDAPDVLLLGALVGASAAAVGLRVVEAADAERLGQEYVTRVRLRIFERIAARPEQPTGPGRYGLTMTRLISDLGSLKNWVSLGIARALVASITLAGLIAALAHVDASLAAAGAGVVLLAAGGAALFTAPLRSRVREARRRRGRLANNLGEKVFAYRTVRHFGRTDRELRRVGGQSRRLRDALVSRMRLSQALRSLPDLGLPLGAGAVVWLSTTRAAGDWTLADGAAAILLLGLLVAALRDLVRAWDYRLSFEEGYRRIATLLEGPRLSERRDAEELDGEGPVALSLRKVRVGDALRRLSVEAAPGERVLVTGPSGSGKSLVMALAARLLDPDAGRVRIDGRPLPRLSLDSVHDTVKLVAPELPLLRGTLGENLAYGAADDEDAAAEAAALCGLLDEPSLPDGLDSRIEEAGQNLPRGVRARVALARAVAARPRLLLVDDPAFSTDADARAALARTIDGLPATVLVTANEGATPIQATRVWDLGASACAGAA